MKVYFAKTGLALVIGLGLSGCAAIGIIADKTSGDQPIPAKYVPPKDKPTVVLIENYRNPDTVSMESDVIEREVEKKLAENKVAPMIESAKLMNLKTSRGEGFAKLSIPQVGKSLGA